MKLSITNLSDIKIKNNLKYWLKLATKNEVDQGKNWYKDAQDFTEYLSKKYGIDSYVCASVISALSPNNKWDRNKIDAEAVINAYIDGHKDVKVCTYNANKNKAFDILNGKLITEKSPKTHAFAMNVGLLSSDHITIDKWHLRACVTKSKADAVESCTSVQYRRIEKITSQIAKENNLKGYELQAIIWVTIRNNWK